VKRLVKPSPIAAGDWLDRTVPTAAQMARFAGVFHDFAIRFPGATRSCLAIGPR